MALWEYKVITSGKGGFASPALLEKFLNDLGRDEWEIVHFQTPPDNFLAFTGLARRSTQRDWTLEDAAAAAAKVEAEKLRAEFEAKFKAASGNAPAGSGEERAPSFLEEKVAPDDGFRKPVDTSHDAEPETEEEQKADEWDKLTAREEDELPTFFEAIKPHMRRNQRGPGMSVGVDYLAKKWEQSEDDLKSALVECGFVVPEDEDAKVEYVEYDGDLYWLNVNRRGELWINTKEKPRPVFRPVKAARVEMEATGASGEGRGASESKPETGDRKPASVEPTAGAPEKAESGAGITESGDMASSEQSEIRNPRSETKATPLPAGAALLDKIRPHMRRNRRGPGGSGSSSFLARALRTNEADLKAAFAGLGMTIPSGPGDKPIYSEFHGEIWWLNLDSRGGLWINGREKRPGETLASASETAAPASEGMVEAPLESAPGSAAPDAVPTPEVAPSATTAVPEQVAASEAHGATLTEALPTAEPRAEPPAATSTPTTNPVLTAIRLLLKETKTGAVASKVERLAEELGKSPDDFVATLVGAGFKVPEKAREKPVFVEHADEILWLNRNAKGELWLNAKASKFAKKTDEEDEAVDGEDAGEGEDADGEAKSRRGVKSRKTEK